MDNNLLVEIKNNRATTTSLKIANYFEKQHKNVLRLLSSLLSSANGDRLSKHFFKTSYKDETGKRNTMYSMDRDGFSFLVMSFKGEKADKWKLDFIEAFNSMENCLKELNATNINKEILNYKQDEVQIAKSKLWLELADRVDIKEYKDLANSYAFNTLAGKNVLPLPEVKELTYSATEVGEIFGVSRNKIGILANRHKLKTDEYGKWFYDKAKNSNKEVQTFRYNRKAIEAFKELIA